MVQAITSRAIMYDFKPAPGTAKPELYTDLLAAAEGLTAGEHDAVANMANVAALLWEYLPDVNWTGFYRAVNGELVLGPFAGRPACIRIPFGQGVCGAAAATGQTQLVADVHAFPGHIACDAASASELVVPVKRDERVIAVIDLDSPIRARFDVEDAVGIEKLAGLLAERICPRPPQRASCAARLSCQRAPRSLHAHPPRSSRSGKPAAQCRSRVRRHRVDRPRSRFRPGRYRVAGRRRAR